MARTQESYADAMTVRSNQYLSAVRECIAVLPATVLRYETDEFETLTSRLCERESNCDAALRKLRRLCGRATPNFTGVYLQAGAVMELYAAVDEVPNAAEDFVRQLDAIRPTLAPQTADDLAEMAALATRATGVLADAIETYAESLVTSGPPADPRGAVEQIAALESRADDRKQRIVRRAFADGPTAPSIVVRDLTAALDETLDAVEDAADHLLFMYGAAP